jgi:hypothetical protein
MLCDGQWGINRMKGGGGMKQITVVAIATAGTLAGVGVGQRSGEGFTAWNSSKWRGDEGASYPG